MTLPRILEARIDERLVLSVFARFENPPYSDLPSRRFQKQIPFRHFAMSEYKASDFLAELASRIGCRTRPSLHIGRGGRRGTRGTGWEVGRTWYCCFSGRIVFMDYLALYNEVSRALGIELRFLTR
jgi:hypothetical protein